MLREFLRNVVFERFPLVAGVCVGLAQGALCAWVALLTFGPERVPAAALVALTAGLVTAQAWSVPRVGLSRVHRAGATELSQLYLGVGFASILVAGAVIAVGGAVGLASLALAPEAGLGPVRAASAAAAAGMGVVLGWGFWGEPRRLEVTRIRVELVGLAAGLGGLRIAHLSDLHIGNGLEGERLERLVAAVNALAPDLVAITGDLFDHDPAALTGGARALARLRAPLGVHAVLGNHDLFTGADAVAAALAEHAPALRLLRGAWVKAPAAAPLYVAGVEDPGHDWTAHGRGLPAIEKLAAAAPNDGPVILLVHRPDAFPQAAELGFALVLAGHFHGGQIALPGSGGRVSAATALTPFHRGVYRSGAALLYVSRGLGFAGPRIRIGSPPEIALLELAHPGA